MLAGVRAFQPMLSVIKATLEDTSYGVHHTRLMAHCALLKGAQGCVPLV